VSAVRVGRLSSSSSGAVSTKRGPGGNLKAARGMSFRNSKLQNVIGSLARKGDRFGVGVRNRKEQAEELLVSRSV